MSRVVLIQHPVDGVVLIDHALEPPSTIGLPLARAVTIIVGAAFVAIITALNVQGDVSYRLSGADAALFTIDDTGRIEVNPPLTAAGLFEVVVTASDAFGSASQRLTIRVVAVDPLPANDATGVVLFRQSSDAMTLIRNQERLLFDASVLPEGWAHVIVKTLPKPFEAFVDIGDAVGYDTNARIAAFTTRMTIDENMNISGTGDALEGSVFTVRFYRLANRFAFSGERDIALGVNEGPIILPIPEQLRRFGEPIDVVLDGFVVDGDVNDESIVSVDLSGMPWAIFDEEEIAITGTAPGPALYTVPISARDRLNNTVNASFILRISNDSIPDPISFRDVEVEELSVIGVGSTVITGIDLPVAVTVEDGEWSLDGITFTANPGVIGNNERLYLRRLSSDINRTIVSVRVSVGGVLGQMRVITAKPTAKLVYKAYRRVGNNVVPLNEGERVMLYITQADTDAVVVPLTSYAVDALSMIHIKHVNLAAGQAYDCPIGDDTTIDGAFLRGRVAVAL